MKICIGITGGQEYFLDVFEECVWLGRGVSVRGEEEPRVRASLT